MTSRRHRTRASPATIHDDCLSSPLHCASVSSFCPGARIHGKREQKSRHTVVICLQGLDCLVPGAVAGCFALAPGSIDVVHRSAINTVTQFLKLHEHHVEFLVAAEPRQHITQRQGSHLRVG